LVDIDLVAHEVLRWARVLARPMLADETTGLCGEVCEQDQCQPAVASASLYWLNV